MDSFESWKLFETTGKVEDYLNYTKERRLHDAREKFLSVIEGEEADGRDNHSSGNGNFLDGYK